MGRLLTVSARRWRLAFLHQAVRRPSRRSVRVELAPPGAGGERGFGGWEGQGTLRAGRSGQGFRRRLKRGLLLRSSPFGGFLRTRLCGSGLVGGGPGLSGDFLGLLRRGKGIIRFLPFVGNICLAGVGLLPGAVSVGSGSLGFGLRLLRVGFGLGRVG